MALERAGVSLEAEGFSQYLKRLEIINKRQQEIFNVTSQKTGKTVDNLTKEYKGFQQEVEKAAAAQKRGQQEAAKLAAAQKTAAATQRQAFISTTQAVFSFVKEVGQAAFELGKLGAQFQGQQVGLNNLAASFGQSGKEIQRAIQEASGGTLSGLQAINAANQGLLLGVAKTPEEFANLTNSALTLGRTLGLDATQSIEQFTSALGRQSLLILDNFGISAKQVNAEIERLAQANFGKARSELTEAQKQATFMEAALNIAGEAAATIGEEAGNAQASFDRLTASAEDFKTEIGQALSDLNKSTGFTDKLVSGINKASKGITIFRGELGGAGIDTQIEATEIKIESLSETIEKTKNALPDFLEQFSVPFQEQELAKLQQQLEDLKLQQVAEDQKKVNDTFDDTPPIIEDNTESIKAYESALKQAQNLQASFAREAEDAARSLARANEDLAISQARQTEDVARKEAKQVSKLQESQAKERDKLLKDQTKQLDKFEKNRRKQISDAEEDIAEARKEANEKRKEDQQKLQRDLQREQERFNLSQLQSGRRFALQDRRLRAEGDVLALQELRENRELELQEEKENFAQGQKEQVQSAEESQKEQAKDLESKINELKSNLEDRRAELLASFDEQLQEQREAQREAQESQRQAFAEDQLERQIAAQRQEEDRIRALEREEEDRRISQRRQLEDLGQSLAEQKDVTAQGVNAIADEIERVFGMTGVANNIIVGFSERTRNEFGKLAENVEETIRSLDEVEKKRDVPLVALTGNTRGGTPSGGFGGRRSAEGIQAFGDGGVVSGPGPIGSPVPVMAHVGETFLPTHQQSFSMNAPVIPSQNLNVQMSGGFDIRGGEAAGEQATQKAITEMTDAFEIVVKRLGRQI